MRFLIWATCAASLFVIGCTDSELPDGVQPAKDQGLRKKVLLNNKPEFAMDEADLTDEQRNVVEDSENISTATLNEFHLMLLTRTCRDDDLEVRYMGVLATPNLGRGLLALPFETKCARRRSWAAAHTVDGTKRSFCRVASLACFPFALRYLMWEYWYPDQGDELFTLRVQLRKSPDTIDEITVRGQRLYLSISVDPNKKLVPGNDEITAASILKRLKKPRF